MRSRKGLTLIEVLVTGALFSIVLTMIAQALVTGQRTQTVLSHKINVYRQASAALDLIVRDVETARSSSYVQYFQGSSPLVPFPVTFQPAQGATPAAPIPTELRVDRLVEGATLYDNPVKVSVGYWRDPNDSTLRQTVYDASGVVVSGTPLDGKVIARDVKKFEVQMYKEPPPLSLWKFSARVQVSTIDEPVLTEVYLAQ